MKRDQLILEWLPYVLLFAGGVIAVHLSIEAGLARTLLVGALGLGVSVVAVWRLP